MYKRQLTNTAKSQFTVQVGGSAVTVNSAALKNGDTSTVVLTLANAVSAGASVAVAYTTNTVTAADNLKDLGNNTVALENFAATGILNSSTQDLTAPTLDASNAVTQVLTDGDKIELKFSEALTALTATAKSQFTVNVGGSPVTVSSAALKTCLLYTSDAADDA